MVKAKDNTENNSCSSVMRYSITLHKNGEKELMWRWYFSFFFIIFAFVADVDESRTSFQRF